MPREGDHDRSAIESDRPILDEQIDYYRARAPEYDEWFLRRGRYDRGEAPNREWFEEVGKVREALDRFAPRGEVLELACGTGLWTERLASRSDRLVALDASPEMIALNRTRLGAAENVEYVQADLFTWRPDRRFDVVFFAFWLSHVPDERFEAFWSLLSDALAPDGRVFFVDSGAPSGSSGSERSPSSAAWRTDASGLHALARISSRTAGCLIRGRAVAAATCALVG